MGDGPIESGGGKRSAASNTAPSRSRRRVVVHGRVQGVGYRVACARRATAAGLGGWVRNIDDGSVEAVFEGEPEAVDAVTEWCAKGPAMARVDRLETFDEPALGERGFSIR